MFAVESIVEDQAQTHSHMLDSTTLPYASKLAVWPVRRQAVRIVRTAQFMPLFSKIRGVHVIQPMHCDSTDCIELYEYYIAY